MMNKALYAIRQITNKDNWCPGEEESKAIPEVCFELMDKLLNYKLPKYSLSGIWDGTLNLTIHSESYRIEVNTDGTVFESIFVAPSNDEIPYYFKSIHGADEGSIKMLAQKINNFVKEYEVENK